MLLKPFTLNELSSLRISGNPQQNASVLLVDFIPCGAGADSKIIAQELVVVVLLLLLRPSFSTSWLILRGCGKK